MNFKYIVIFNILISKTRLLKILSLHPNMKYLSKIWVNFISNAHVTCVLIIKSHQYKCLNYKISLIEHVCIHSRRLSIWPHFSGPILPLIFLSGYLGELLSLSQILKTYLIKELKIPFHIISLTLRLILIILII